MNIVNRVQIVPLGYEKQRVLEPIYRFKADRVVLIRQIEEQDYEASFQREVVDELESNRSIDLEVRECNLFDLDDAIESVVDAIRDYADDEVFVNVSTGSKITAIAAMIACQTTDATPFYVEPEYRTDGKREAPEEPLVDDIGAIYDLPAFPLQGPTPQQREMLAYLAENDGATKKELIEVAQRRELPFIAESESKSDEGRYRLLETHIIDPLEDDDCIRVEKVGREKHVFLEEKGRDVLRTFPTDRSES